MALISLFTTTRAKLDQMELDASLSETHEATATLTDSEVEDGTSITDHVVLLPLQVTIEGTVSKTPLNASALIGSVASTAGGAAGSTFSNKLAKTAAVVGVASVGALVAKAVDGQKREPRDVYDYLLELRDRRQPMQIITALKIYDSMIITSVSVPRSSETTGETRFTVAARQVKIVKSETVNLSLTSTLGNGAAAKANLGKQSASGVSSKIDASASKLYQLGQAAGAPLP